MPNPSSYVELKFLLWRLCKQLNILAIPKLLDIAHSFLKDCEQTINQSFPYIDLSAILAVSLKMLFGFNDKKDTITQISTS